MKVSHIFFRTTLFICLQVRMSTKFSISLKIRRYRTILCYPGVTSQRGSNAALAADLRIYAEA
jgi:hypothetical protein